MDKMLQYMMKREDTRCDVGMGGEPPCSSFLQDEIDLRVSIHGGIPKWMVYRQENAIKMDDLGVPLETFI